MQVVKVGDLMPIERIENKIYFIRGQKVMLDRDLAELYGIDNRNLKRQVRRNRHRFPTDFMFILSQQEQVAMVRHFGTPLRSIFGGSAPFAFTEHGILMLSSILNSKRAISVNIRIMRIFVKFRMTLASHRWLAGKIRALEEKSSRQDLEIKTIFQVLKKIMEPSVKQTRRIGFP
jgi:hypothetical protein